MDATLSSLLTIARQEAGDVDPLAARYPDQAYLAVLRVVLLELQARRQLFFGEMVLNLTEGAETLTPVPRSDELVILAKRTAHGILTQEYRRRVASGELGISWRSGLEEESSIQAEKAYAGLLAALAREADELLAIGSASLGFHGFRSQ